MNAQPKKYQVLEGAIDAVVQSYDEEWPINNLKSAALPNSRKVIEAMRELEPVLFMGFYSTRGLTRANLRHQVAEHLYRAHDILVEQIERALTYQDWHGRCEHCPRPGTGEDVVLGIFAKLPEIRRKLNGDVQAAFQGDPAAVSLEEVVFSYPSIRAVMTYRLAHEFWMARIPMLPRILSEYAHSETGVDIHPNARIGERFFIDHGTGVVIGATTIIGNDVKLYQGVTLGALSIPRRGYKKKRHPTLEHGVTVYAGATILGGQTVVGEGSIVGGNVWLTHSVPAGSKVIFGRDTDAHGEHTNGATPPATVGALITDDDVFSDERGLGEDLPEDGPCSS